MFYILNASPLSPCTICPPPLTFWNLHEIGQKKNGHFPYYHLTVEIKYARKVVYILISAEFIITVLIDGDTFEYVHFLWERGRLSGIVWEKKIP